MDALYNDLLAILDYAEDNAGSAEQLEGITADNVRYIKGVVAAAARAHSGEGVGGVSGGGLTH